MIADTGNTTAHRLLEAFARFRTLNRKHSLIAGLTPGEMMILWGIKRAAAYESAGIKVSKISDLLNIASPTVTQYINNLEAQGFVRRAVDSEDRRVVRVGLTDKGESVVNRATEELLSRFKGLVEYLGEEESRQLAVLLSKAFTYLDEAGDDH